MKCRNQACLLNKNKKCTSPIVLSGKDGCVNMDVEKPPIDRDKYYSGNMLVSKTKSKKKRSDDLSIK